MSKQDDAEALFKTGMNCSQAVFCAFAGDYGFNDDLAAKTSAGLGGGVGRMREVCGTVSGAAMVLGLAFGPDKAAVYAKVQEFAAAFKAETGSIVCRELLAGTGATTGGTPEPRSETFYKKRPCVELVRLSAGILERMLNA